MAYEMDFCVRIMYPLKELLFKYSLLHQRSSVVKFSQPTSLDSILKKYGNKRLPYYELDSMSFPYFDYQRFYNLRCRISQEILIREDFIVLKYKSSLYLQIPHKDHVDYDCFDDDEIHYEYEKDIPMIGFTITDDEYTLQNQLDHFYNLVFDFMKITHPNEMKIALEKQE